MISKVAARVLLARTARLEHREVARKGDRGAAASCAPPTWTWAWASLPTSGPPTAPERAWMALRAGRAPAAPPRAEAEAAGVAAPVATKRLSCGAHDSCATCARALRNPPYAPRVGVRPSLQRSCGRASRARAKKTISACWRRKAERRLSRTPSCWRRCLCRRNSAHRYRGGR